MNSVPWALAGLVDGDDVPVVERGRDLRLAQEPRAETCVLRQSRRQQLQRHGAIQPQVVGEVDDPHPASAQQPLDPVARQVRTDARIRSDAHVRPAPTLIPYRRMVKTTVYLPEPLKAKLERVAARERRSEADVIRAALDEYTTGRVRPQLPLFEGKNSPPDLAERDEEYLAGFGED